MVVSTTSEKGPLATNVELHSMEPLPTTEGLHKTGLEQVETYHTTYDQAVTGNLFRNGQLVKLPAASRDPRDPLNLPLWRKIVALGFTSFFGALIISAELILGAALPVFALEYAGIDPKILRDITTLQGGFPAGSNPLKYLESIGGPPIFEIYLLATLPVLVIALANLFLVPLAISIGRRPVFLILGCLAIAGAAWAGESQSIGSHIGARVVQGIGAGSVESLIPFIIQDCVHVHQRNTWISAAFALQGVIIIAIGFASPYMIIYLSWRWIYHITAILAGFFLIGVFFFLPETRWPRTRAEMNGVPRDDVDTTYAPRTYMYDLRLYSGTDFKKGAKALWDTFRTFFYPSILIVTLLNGSVIATAFAAGFTAAPALITNPWSWPFFNLGLCLIAVLVGAGLVLALNGATADHIANAVAKRRGQRVPENQLLNLILPWACSLIGSVLYGVSANNEEKFHWIIFLMALSFMTFGFLGISTITTVYVLECYPHMAGPSLVNVASFRWIMAFFLTLWASDWIVDMGYLHTFLMYTALIGFFGLFLPLAYYYGPAWRRRYPGFNQIDY